MLDLMYHCSRFKADAGMTQIVLSDCKGVNGPCSIHRDNLFAHCSLNLVHVRTHSNTHHLICTANITLSPRYGSGFDLDCVRLEDGS